MIAVPFNHQPVNTEQSSTSYTVPSGKYARVVVTLSVDAYISQTPNIGADTSGANIDSSNGCNSTSLDVRLIAGQVLTKSNSSASASVTSTNGNLDSRSIASLSVDGTLVAEIYASASLKWRSTASTPGSISGNSSTYWHIEEYNELT